MDDVAKASFYEGESWDTDLSLFADVVANPNQWLGSAEEHLYAAHVLLPHVKQRLDAMLECLRSKERKPLVPDLAGSFFLHCALVMENSLKALISDRFSNQIRSEAKNKAKTPKILLGHDLVDLARRIDWPLSFDDEYMLVFLTRRGVWAGKYHAPIKHLDNSLTEELSDGNHHLTGGYSPEAISDHFAFCESFLAKAKKQINLVSS